MSSRAPIVRQVSWLLAVPQMAAMAAVIAAAWFVTRSFVPAVWAGGGVYLAYSVASKLLIARAHRRGIRLFKRQKYAEAIPRFEESYEFFSRHPQVDRYRSITMMSCSAASYGEMALINIAFCYGQLGQGAKAKEYYQRALAEFPDSGMAIAALKMFEAAEQHDGDDSEASH